VAGSPEAVRTVRAWIEPICRHHAWGGVDADEMLQEVLLRLTVTLRRGTFEHRSSLKTFACAVAKVTCLEARRYARRDDPAHGPGTAGIADGAAESDSPESAVLRRERRSLLAYVAQQVSEECRELWSLAFGQELTSSEIGRRMGLSAGAVRVRLHRCLKHARELAERVSMRGRSPRGRETPR
jgi:RNA polymerase sigma-70 factor (ECF subfamily)